MPLRLYLAICNALAIGAAIVLLGAVTYVVQARNLSQELDESLRNQARNLTNLYQVRASLSPRARERVIPQPSVFSAPAFHVQVLDPEGQIVERSAGLGNRRLPINPEALRHADEGQDALETVNLEGQDVRLFTVALVADEEFLGYLQVARSLEALEDALGYLRPTLIGGGALILFLSMVAAWLLAGMSLRPIVRIARAANEIGRSGRLERRLPPLRTGDEIAHLVQTFNRMMDRLESAFAAQRRFAADASHELRTPLTTIRGNLELLRRNGAVPQGEMREALEDVNAEAQRMSRLVDQLLALARADAGQRLARVPVRLDELVRAVHREAQAVAEGVAVGLAAADPVEAVGDPDALKQLLLVLVDNGIKYTPPGGTVTLSLRFHEGEAVLAVRDTGVGISEAESSHIFERFYRSPLARGSGGSGLGLAIAQWIASEHRTRIEVESTPGAGSTFTVRIRHATLAQPVGQSPPVPNSQEEATSPASVPPFGRS